MRKESLTFLTKYLNNPSPTGFETSGQKMWLEYIKPYIDSYMTDVYGNTVGIVNPKAKYKVVIEAHADEIAWFVNYISDTGFIYVKRLGGSDHIIAPSMKVNIHTEKKGIVTGVFGWPAIHVRDKAKEDTPNANLKNLTIDVGAANKEEVGKMGISVGNVVTFDANMFTMNKQWIVGRALDNRIGGFMIAEAARMLKEKKKKLPFGLYIVNAVQEEVGLRGAEIISRRIKPDVAIVTDVCHDTTSPLYDKIAQGERACGKGPVLAFGPAVQNNLLSMLFDVADKKKIPYQRTTVGAMTGTDTDAFAYSGEGVASALISLPLKYMHTTVEMVHEDDVQNVINLIYEFLLALPDGHDFRYIK